MFLVETQGSYTLGTGLNTSFRRNPQRVSLLSSPTLAAFSALCSGICTEVRLDTNSLRGLASEKPETSKLPLLQDTQSANSRWDEGDWRACTVCVGGWVGVCVINRCAKGGNGCW